MLYYFLPNIPWNTRNAGVNLIDEKEEWKNAGRKLTDDLFWL